MEERNCIVYATRGSKTAKFTTSATTWGELKSILEGEHGYENVNGMKAMLRNTRATLEMEEALLPAEDFQVYLSPTKSKFGAQEMSFAEARAKVAEIGTPIKEFLTDKYYPKNWTRLTKEELVAGVQKFEESEADVVDVSFEDVATVKEVEATPVLVEEQGADFDVDKEGNGDSPIQSSSDLSLEVRIDLFKEMFTKKEIKSNSGLKSAKKALKIAKKIATGTLDESDLILEQMKREAKEYGL